MVENNASRLPRQDVDNWEKLGAGALGSVWKATDRLLERDLAVKFLTSTDEFLDEQALLREARSLAKISHPNLVTVYGAAWLSHPETGLVAPAIMMELLIGEHLLKWEGLQRERSAVLQVAIDLVEAIRAMHASGLHHGDLHDRNVMVLSNGRTKVIDWRYQDTFLSRSTASRMEIIDSDMRRAVDIVVSLFEKQGLKNESLELRGLADLDTVLKRLIEFRSPSATTAVELQSLLPNKADSVLPFPQHINRELVKGDETTELHAELILFPSETVDLDVSELISEFDTVMRDFNVTTPLKWLFKEVPTRGGGFHRWACHHRPYLNVFNKWELEIRDGAYLASRWARFGTGEILLFELHDMLTNVVPTMHLYEQALAGASRYGFQGMSKIGAMKVNVQFGIDGTKPLLLSGSGDFLSRTIHSVRSSPSWQVRMEARTPAEAGSNAERLFNRALSNFQAELSGGGSSLVRLDSQAFRRYVSSMVPKKE